MCRQFSLWPGIFAVPEPLEHFLYESDDHRFSDGKAELMESVLHSHCTHLVIANDTKHSGFQVLAGCSHNGQLIKLTLYLIEFHCEWRCATNDVGHCKLKDSL